MTQGAFNIIPTLGCGCGFGIKAGDCSWIVNNLLQLTSNDGTVKIDACTPGTIDFSTNTTAVQGAVNCITSVTGRVLDDELTLVISQENCDPVEGTINVSALLGGSGTLNCINNISGVLNPNSGNLAMSIGQDNCDDATTNIDLSALLNENSQISYCVNSISGSVDTTEQTLKISLNQENCEGDPEGIIDISSLFAIVGGGCCNTGINLDYTGNTLTVEVEQTFGPAVSETVDIPIPDPITNSAATMTWDSNTCEIVTTITDSNNDDVESRFNLSNILLEALCKIPSEELSSVHTELFMLATNTQTGKCVKIVAPICPTDEVIVTPGCVQPAFTGADILDNGVETATNNVNPLSALTVRIYFDQEVIEVGGSGAQGVDVFDEVGTNLNATFTYDGIVGPNNTHQYSWTPSNLQFNFSYNVVLNTAVATTSDSTCVLSNPGTALSLNTITVPNNVVNNSSSETVLSPWNDGGGTVQLVLDNNGARGTNGWLTITADSTGPVQILQNGLNLATGTYRFIFWHMGGEMSARVIRDTSPFTQYTVTTIPASTTWAPYEIEFTMSTAEANARIQFIDTTPVANSSSFSVDEVYLGRIS